MKANVSLNVGDRTLTIQSGRVAKQASGSVMVKYGETVVLVTVVSEKEEKDSNFLPLSVEYQEKIYAAGRIPGNYFRREIGRPSEKETLTARLIDRPIRPLFPKGYKFETQIIATVLSMDHENDPDVLSVIGASAALTVSDIPFDGPIAAVRIGRIDGKFVINPLIEQIALSDINIVVASSKTGVVMVEGSSNIVCEKDILEAVFFGQDAIRPIIQIQEELEGKIGKRKRNFSVSADNQAFVSSIYDMAFPRLRDAMLVSGKLDRRNALQNVRTEILNELDGKVDEGKAVLDDVFDAIQRKICRDLILVEGKRIDGRAFDEVRPVFCETGVLPRPHGSALFTRGETQVLGVLTLGSGQDEQRVETLSGEEHRAFMLHYNFPPFSVGEVKRVGSPSRRDIGHGGLSTRALENIIPERDIFDYTIRIVSEVLESNGSSSMGTVCAGTLALMDGGVPIKFPVAGIAMGLVKEGDNFIVLTDILGDEDHAGDMDFKVTGTAEGITAFQMDVKVKGLSMDIMEMAMEQARVGRLSILGKMLDTIDSPRELISPYAPRILTMTIPSDKIRDVIGPGGKIIRALQSETNTKIEVDDSGLIKVTANTFDEANVAINRVKEITAEPEVGMTYSGKVMKTTDFGAFVQIIPGIDGLVHISQLADHRIKKVTDMVREGDNVRVKVLEISKDGKIRLSMKAVEEDDI